MTSDRVMQRLASRGYCHVLIDWDGTIVLSHSNIARSFIAAASETGTNLDEETIARQIGRPLPELFRLMLAQDGAPSYTEFYTAFLRHYGEGCAAGREPVIPEARELVEWIVDSRLPRLPLSVASNKQASTLALSMRAAQLGDVFTYVLDAMRFAPKPDTSMCRFVERSAGVSAGDILMVGDSDVDRTFAELAGCDFLPFSVGPWGGDALEPSDVVRRLRATRV
jgi:phosphoglycolate phosphatase-like HAD superfamily hydrolase